jgi:hypothetical protein
MMAAGGLQPWVTPLACMGRVHQLTPPPSLHTQAMHGYQVPPTATSHPGSSYWNSYHLNQHTSPCCSRSHLLPQGGPNTPPWRCCTTLRCSTLATWRQAVGSGAIGSSQPSPPGALQLAWGAGSHKGSTSWPPSPPDMHVAPSGPSLPPPPLPALTAPPSLDRPSPCLTAPSLPT